MPLSYAGVTLPVQTRECSELIERLIPVSELKVFEESLTCKDRIAFTVMGTGVLDRPVKPGTLFWPRGASHWSVAYFVVDETTLNQIRSAGPPASTANLVMDDGQGGTITASMWMLPAHPLLGIPGFSSLWLLILVDSRYWWWFPDTGVVNLPFPVTTTWANLYTTCGTQANTTINADPINSAYLNPHPALAVVNARIPPYIDTIAYNVGQDIVVDLGGKVHAYNRTTSLNILNTNTGLTVSPLAGDTLSLTVSNTSDTPGVLPGSVQMSFEKLHIPASGTSGTLFSPTAVSTVTATYNSLSLPAATTSSIVRTFREADFATFNPSNTWTNQTQLQALVNQFATDWYTRQLASVDAVYGGIVPWQPEGISASIEWTYREDMVCTRVQRPAFNDEAEDLYHTTNAGQIGPAVSNLAWVLINTPANSSSITLPSGSITGYGAKIATQDPNTGVWGTGATVWFVGVNSEVPLAGKRYQCRFFENDQGGTPIWENADPEVVSSFVSLNWSQAGNSISTPGGGGVTTQLLPSFKLTVPSAGTYIIHGQVSGQLNNFTNNDAVFRVMLVDWNTNTTIYSTTCVLGFGGAGAGQTSAAINAWSTAPITAVVTLNSSLDLGLLMYVSGTNATATMFGDSNITAEDANSTYLTALRVS